MSQMLLPILPGTLPPGVCYANEQDRLLAFAENMEAILAGGLAYYNYGSDTPSVENQGFPWFRTTDGRWYFFSGSWKSPVNYSTYERRLFVGSTTDLLTYDGGAAGTVTATTGPMWEVDTDFAGRSPMAPGDIPSANPAKTLAVGENYGEGAHTMTEEELAPHDHAPRDGFAAYAGFVDVGQPSSYEIDGGSEIERMGATGEGGGEDDGSGNLVAQPMPVIHPVRGCYIIKWTGRQFYTV
jgi:hypothetical protein